MNRVTTGLLLAALGVPCANAGPYGQDGYQTGPRQFDWPPPGGVGYAQPSYPGIAQGGYGAWPPATQYQYAGRYPDSRYQQYSQGYRPQIDYVAPPGPDWSPQAAEQAPTVPPEVLIKDGSMPLADPGVGGDAPRQQVPGIQSGYPIGFQAGMPVEVVPPPNMPLTPHDLPTDKRMISGGWRPMPPADVRLISQ